MTLLVAGLILGGWALILGAVALVVHAARLAARRRPRVPGGGRRRPDRPPRRRAVALVADGDVRGARVDPGRRPAAELRAAAELQTRAEAGPLASAVAGGGGGRPRAVRPAAQPARTPTSSRPPRTRRSSSTTLTGAGGQRPFTIAFDNKDQGQPHNIAINDAVGCQLFMGEIVTGPKVVVYDVPALPAGTYTFVCSVHPNMTGTLTAPVGAATNRHVSPVHPSSRSRLLVAACGGGADARTGQPAPPITGTRARRLRDRPRRVPRPPGRRELLGLVVRRRAARSSRCSRSASSSSAPRTAWSCSASCTRTRPSPRTQFLDEFGATWPTVTDPGDAIAKAYRVVAPPQTYFIDADGILQGIQIGEVLPEDFDTQYAKIAP